MTGTTNHKAWSGGLAGAIVVLVVTGIAHATGLIAMPDKTVVEMALYYVIEAAVTFIVTYASVWLKANLPRPPGEPDRFMSHWAAALAAGALALLLAACAGTGAYATCSAYEAALNSLASFRIAGQIDAATADRINEIDEVAGPMCENPGALGEGDLDAIEDAIFELQGIEADLGPPPVPAE
ncbi:MAG TPA: hypothetical protein VF188_00210 [Longimicrobiales bacterium]|jgi:hypothetical protein